jgi:sialic acid synthase SpsE
LIEAAKKCGADAVKIQIFNTEEMVTRSADKAPYQKQSAPGGESQFAMLKKYELGIDDIVYIKSFCNAINLELMATPFDFSSLVLMEKLGFATIKVSSGDLTNIPLLKRINETGKKVILSTGMANLAEIEEALAVFDRCEHNPVLLHCTSNYPVKMEDVNLKAIETLKCAFKKPVGFSDHTAGIEIAIAAAALGAEIIEKHFTLDGALPGPDHRASLEPRQFAKMVESIRNLETAWGDGIKQCRDSEAEIRQVARKSIVAKEDIKAGELLTESNLAVKRPGTGLHPRYYDFLTGKRAVTDINKDQQIKLTMVAGDI